MLTFPGNLLFLCCSLHNLVLPEVPSHVISGLCSETRRQHLKCICLLQPPACDCCKGVVGKRGDRSKAHPKCDLRSWQTSNVFPCLVLWHIWKIKQSQPEETFLFWNFTREWLLEQCSSLLPERPWGISPETLFHIVLLLLTLKN